MKPFDDYHQRHQTISDWEHGLRQTIREKWGLGWKAYFVTLQYRPLPGNIKVKSELMNREVDRVAKFLMTRLYRNPNSVPKEIRPIWFVFPDFPVYKTNKVSLREVTINDGLHQHAIVLIPVLGARTNLRLDEHFRDCKNQYVFEGEDTPLVVLDAVPIKPTEPDLETVVSYAMKAIANGRAEIDDIYIPTFEYRRRGDPDSPFPGPGAPRQYGARRAPTAPRW